ncbi:MAG: nuclear transport factor 2 family protein, partial [Marinilabiliaceae bacterium]|nr:nuclear transport factor 2 family protein [Marinilabiliaceae bacterium]
VGFHPGFNLLGVDQGNNLTKLPIYSWEAGVRKRVEAGQLPKVETTAKYPLVDITGKAAMVKVELYREGKKIFTDYLQLYKFEEGWRIVSKIYHSWPKE